MKNFLKNTYWILSALLLSFSACDDAIDLDPNQSIDSATALATPQNLDAALIGAYDELSDGDFLGGELQMFSDIMGDRGDASFRGTFEEYRDAEQRFLDAFNGIVAGAWIDGYDAIILANRIIAAAGQVEGAGDNLIPEARFIRGVSYFELVRAFGRDWNDGNPAENPGIPLILDAPDNPGGVDPAPRATVSAIYTQAIEDLTFAVANLNSWGGDPAFGTSAAANAWLARIYTQQGNWAQAEAAATAAIDEWVNNGGNLVNDVQNLFANTPNAETIYTLAVNAQDGVNNFSTYYSDNARGDMEISATHFDRYESANDARATLFDASLSFTIKWDDIVEGDVVLFRAAELYLLRAEARIRQNDEAGAKADIDLIRTRAGLDPWDTAFPATPLTVADVYDEMEIELAFEGHFLNIARKRKQTDIDLQGLEWNDPFLLLPIPQREMDVNSALVQNSAYTGG